MIRDVLFALTALLAAATIARADEVRLASGDRISGRLVSLSGGTLTFSTPHGDLKIPWKEVIALAVDSPILVTVGTNPPAAVAKAAGDATSGLALDPAPGAVAFADIVAITRPQPPVTIDGGANAGFLASGGNTDVDSLRLDGDIVVRAAANRYTASAAMTRAEDRGVATARSWSTLFKYDRFLTTRLFVNGNAIFTNDRFRDLDLRTALGAGVGYQFLDTPRVTLTADAGIGWVNENFTTLEDDRYAALREAAAIAAFVVPDRVQLFHQHDGYFGVTGDDNLFVRTQNGARVGLAAGFVTTLRLDVDYDRSPAPGRRNTDRTFAVTLGYRF